MQFNDKLAANGEGHRGGYDYVYSGQQSEMQILAAVAAGRA